MQFGTFLLMQSPSMRPSDEIYHRAVEITQAADALGFQNVWLAEHHFSNYGYSARPLQTVIHLADKTERIRVGIAVIILPFHHPLIVAEEIATADVLTGGRLDVGLGRGYQPYEFDRLGLTIEQSRERWEEAVDVIEQALTAEAFSYQGKYYTIPDTAVLPRPVQKPFPPFFVAGQNVASITAAVRRGFDVVTGGAGVSFARLVEFGHIFRESVQQFQPARRLFLGINRAVYVTDDEAEARRMAEEVLWNMRVTLGLRGGYARVTGGRATAIPFANEPPLEVLRRDWMTFGTPDQVYKQICRYRDEVGITHFNCSFWSGDMPQAKVLRSMERFASEVMPRFQEQLVAV
jgi:alkanesulfonate monooxygenase SsuD/methylene tetrahydromethanopterin reductase-like flavin-dependent oxidoreductase (luciferase family)